MPSVKLIVTSRRALRRKYGAAGLARIDRALQAVVRADARRGLTSELLSVAADGDARTVKRAVDRACRALAPHYVVLLGAPDVVPHVPLRNPFVAADDDPDPEVPSDLPYACDAAYGRGIGRFVGPTRVVGRVPDQTGASDPEFLLRQLEQHATWRQRPLSAYESCFALTAQVWRRSTQASVRALLGRAAPVHESPPRGPRWSRRELAHRLVFINCHGAPADPMFYGEAGGVQTDALLSTELRGAVPAGAVGTAECCYGADLYDPSSFGVAPGICSEFLRHGGHAWFGSTTVSYGPASGMNYADLICRFFLEAVRAGASTGRAALEARLRYVAAASPLDPTDLKTLAQFVLLGDPSIHPVRVSAPGGGKTDARTTRRRQLAARGRLLARTAARAESRESDSATAHAARGAEDAARRRGLDPHQVLSYRLTPGQWVGKAAAGLRRAQVEASGRYHVVFARPPKLQPSILNAAVLVLREDGGVMRVVGRAEQKGRLP